MHVSKILYETMMSLLFTISQNSYRILYITPQVESSKNCYFSLTRKYCCKKLALSFEKFITSSSIKLTRISL